MKALFRVILIQVSQHAGFLLNAARLCAAAYIKLFESIELQLHFDQKQVGGRTWSFKDGVAEVIDFDVALTNSEKEGTSAGIGVLLGSINLGAKGASEEVVTSATRIKFSVPILLSKGKALDTD